MKIIRDNFKKELRNPTFIVLGSFDGIHLGHRALINNAVYATKLYNANKKQNQLVAKAMVCTFRNHPLTIINKDLAPKLIMDNNKRVEILEGLGVDIVNLMEFNKDFMKISPENFIQNLKRYYNVAGIIVGFNYRFGYKNLGDVELLEKLSNSIGFQLNVVKPVIIEGEVVSSSAIRHHIQEGNIERANTFLQRPFMLSGKVIKGRQIGRTIGFPTINLGYNKKFIIPKGGVYYSYVEYNGTFYRGITNVGYNPTVEGRKLSIETHVLDFKESIYDKEVRIYFITKIRDEKKFNSVEDLKAQLKADEEFAKSKQWDFSWK